MRVGYTRSCRPSRHAIIIAVWELADCNAASTWLACNPDLAEPGDDAGATSPAPTVAEPGTPRCCPDSIHPFSDFAKPIGLHPKGDGIIHED
jgi:hypothetical protein